MDLFLLSVIAASALCAVYTQAEREYRFVYERKNMAGALSHCRDNYTDLASIHDMKDVELLNKLANLSRMVYSEYSLRAWIGLYDDVESWRWSLSDGSFYKPGESTFRNWSPGEPDTYKSREHCASLLYHSGLWSDRPCGSSYKPVCSEVTGPNVTFVLVNTTMTWTKAQSYCREHHTDLASVRNMDENQRVAQLVPPGENIWIGLNRESWKWKDGSSSLFRYWKKSSHEPNNNFKNEKCVSADFSSSGEWEDWPCHYKRAFICYRVVADIEYDDPTFLEVPKASRVVKVRLVKSSSSLDLNDPAVMDAMLKQLKQKLKDQGLNEDVKLSWRKQADRKVFHKEKKIKKRMITKARDEL